MVTDPRFSFRGIRHYRYCAGERRLIKAAPRSRRNQHAAHRIRYGARATLDPAAVTRAFDAMPTLGEIPSANIAILSDQLWLEIRSGQRIFVRYKNGRLSGITLDHFTTPL